MILNFYKCLSYGARKARQEKGASNVQEMVLLTFN